MRVLQLVAKKRERATVLAAVAMMVLATREYDDRTRRQLRHEACSLCAFSLLGRIFVITHPPAYASRLMVIHKSKFGTRKTCLIRALSHKTPLSDRTYLSYLVSTNPYRLQTSSFIQRQLFYSTETGFLFCCCGSAQVRVPRMYLTSTCCACDRLVSLY